ncbi:MAG TPA: HNH endonuclease [Pseudonocardiaceae bacterium]
MPDRQPSLTGARRGRTPREDACPTRLIMQSVVLVPPEHPQSRPEPGHADPGAGRTVPTAPWGRRRVLLLNATYEPLTALPLRRAVVLMVCGKAEVVHGDSSGLVLHSAAASVEVPSVIRLRTYVYVPYRARVPLTRAALMHRDRYRCVYCGARAETIDHVVPRSRGGQHTWENCVASCARCNHRKADRLLAELGWRLRADPAAPRGQHWRLLATLVDADPLWLPYLGEAA